MRSRQRLNLVSLCLVAFAGALVAPAVSASAGPSTVFEGPVPAATCGPGSSPETGIQGEVTRADRDSGRSQQGYRCNLELLGQYQGQGTTWVSQSYDTCAYHSQASPSSVTSAAPGVQVLDVRNPRRPVLAGALTSPAFRSGTWETLKVNTTRKLLAGVEVGPALGAAFFDIYDISDCKNPKLLNSVSSDELSIPANLLGHEGNWSPDGKTYWSTSLVGGQITAIDVSDPKLPKVIFTDVAGATNHGLSLSQDGNRLYLAEISLQGVGGNGLKILDVSQVQARATAPRVRKVGGVTWTDGSTGQHAIHLTYQGKPYVLFVDELGSGAARIIDIADETQPRVVSKLKLAIQMPAAADQRAKSAGSGSFGYDAHYCDVDNQVNPTAVACGYFESGVRVFDIRNPLTPREIAYFNPPAQVGKAAQLPGSEHASGVIKEADLSADWCSSPPRFVGKNQLWVTCQDNGFMALRFTNSAFPLTTARAVTPATSTKTVSPAVTAPVSDAASPSGRSLAATGARDVVPIAALAMLTAVAALVQTRRRRHSGTSAVDAPA